MMNPNQDSESDIYPSNSSSYAPSTSSPPLTRRYPLEGEPEIPDTSSMMDCIQRWQREEESESPVSVADALSWNSRDWNLTSMPVIQHDLERVQHAHSHSYTSHGYTTGSGIGASHSGHSPRQSIPRDVSNAPRSFLSYLENETVNVKREVDQQPEAKEVADFVSERVKAKKISDSTLCAIDPGCIRSIVRFDYSCLDELDDELILRPRNAFAELCWSTVAQNHPRSRPQALSRNLTSSHPSPKPISGSVVSIPPRLPTPTSSFYPRSLKDTSNITNIEVFSVYEPELDTGSETDNSSNTNSWIWHGSIEEADVMMVTGRQSLNALERYGGSSAKGSDRDINTATVFVPAESIPTDMKDVYHYRHDNSADSHLNFSHHRYNDCDELALHRQKRLETDAGSFISFDDDDDDAPIPRLNYTHIRTPHASPCLHMYAGVANPQESIGSFPIPVAESKASRIRMSPKSSRYVGGLGSSVSKFCQAAFPISGRVLKR